MASPLRFLVIDGYSKHGRGELVAGGASLAADLYAAMLKSFAPDAVCDILFPSDADAGLPRGAELAAYDGVAWTGCSLTIFHDVPEVRAQIDLCREIFAAGIPSFGSCWAAQIAVVAAGGACRANPKGREMGIARKITLTPEGRDHPMYDGKAAVFDAFISHVDEITELPPGATHLAANAFTRVQSVAVSYNGGTFWGLQYHPEYDLHEMARLAFCRTDKLIELGFFRSREDTHRYVDLMETLHSDPSRTDIAWLLGIDDDITDVAFKRIEVKNWIERLVVPGKAERG
jgi:GMP synthase (glutamine-hydrolysing)